MNKVILSFAVVGGVIASLPLGCSSSSSTADADAGADAGPVVVSASADAACTALAQAICDRTSACTPFALSAIYGDASTCLAREKISCTATLAAPSAGATPTTAQACADSFPSLSCDDFSSGNFGTACKVQPGKLALGATCGDSSQCASTFCASGPASNCGTCATVTSVGDACVNGACSAGLSCNTTTMKCIAPGAGKAGTSCTSNADCDLAHAVGCDTTGGKCVALTVASGPGDTCGADAIKATMFTLCPAGGDCSGSVLGKCIANASDGASCDSTNGPYCLLPAKCVSGSCALPNASACN